MSRKALRKISAAGESSQMFPIGTPRPEPSRGPLRRAAPPALAVLAGLVPDAVALGVTEPPGGEAPFPVFATGLLGAWFAAAIAWAIWRVARHIRRLRRPEPASTGTAPDPGPVPAAEIRPDLELLMGLGPEPVVAPTTSIRPRWLRSEEDRLPTPVRPALVPVDDDRDGWRTGSRDRLEEG